MRSLLIGLALPALVLGGDILKTSGFSPCLSNSDITVNNVNVAYDRANQKVTFDVAGHSSKVQKVTASLIVTAYGKQVYQKDFNPCDAATKVDQLCPVPSGDFGAKGSQDIPPEFASMIPAIAFQIPDLDGEATLKLKSASGGKDLACIRSVVGNGKTLEAKGVSYFAAGIAGAALVLTGVSAIGAAGTAGVPSTSPSFTHVIGWFQSMALNGMLSVNYPPVYRSFTKNFAFSGGLIPWNQMQLSIDRFRNTTGGNLTEDSVAYLQNATLVYTDSPNSNGTNITKRGLDDFYRNVFLAARDVSTTLGVQGDANKSANGTKNESKTIHFVHGVQGYVETLMIPQSNTFMTVLLIFAIVVAAIAVGILLFKVILEVWALFASFPKSLTGFRKRYWSLLANTIVNLILVLYGIWTLYCVYQFTHGDSWAAKLLAGVTLGLFTAILGFYTFRIWQLARRYKKAEGDASALFEDKETWRKYSLFYDQYKKGAWWLFIPVIVYMFARGCVIAAGDGHGLAQTGGQLIVEALMLALLVWNRPYATKAGNWINIFIQVIRVLSVVCILVFVERFGITSTTKTITGVVLVAVQSTLTGALAILIAVNAIIICCRKNPHRKKRKEAEKLNRDLDNLTPLDPRNSLLVDPHDLDSKHKGPMVSERPGSFSRTTSYNVVPLNGSRDQTPLGRSRDRDSAEALVGSAARMGRGHTRDESRDSLMMSTSPPHAHPHPYQERQPSIPNLGGYPGPRAY